ncbi:response regulator [Nitrosococcus watsonii]|uniref:Response regulator receiver protein n=1 Tax=Nitrosococcus watsoni (strain C-113) TaxID=105559 RepID=D8K8A2_NITWC|nr:response regulator [Nitrosococcus watsonii]ADJ27097.1 response regulator receiver protein [Nitrosococcus watsonii C-113]
MAHILVVDDSSTETHAFRIMLEKKGFTVSFANNGLEGMTKAKTLKPDLILMDVVMPQVNGFQATRKLKRDPETAEIPVIIISAKNQETDRVWGLRQGAKGYLSKPVDKEELFNKINMLINS